MDLTKMFGIKDLIGGMRMPSGKKEKQQRG